MVVHKWFTIDKPNINQALAAADQAKSPLQHAWTQKNNTQKNNTRAGNKENNDMTRSPKVTITREAHESLVNQIAKLRQDSKQHADKLKEAKEAERSKVEEKHKAVIAELRAKVEAKNNSLAEQKLEIIQLKKRVADLLKASVQTGKGLKNNQKEDMVEYVKEATKNFLFRTIKFVEDTDDLHDVTKCVMKYIDVDIGLDEEEFIATYSDVVSSALSAARNYVQSEGKKRAEGKLILMMQCSFFPLTYPKFWLPLIICLAEYYKKHGNLPETVFLCHIYEKYAANPDDEEVKQAMLWYSDRWLPVIAGKDFFGPNVRYYSCPTDLVLVHGEQKVAVTVTTEAFGLLVFENCRNKWMKMWEWKANNPDKAIPNKGPIADTFKALYTDSKVGQIPYGGWDPEAYELMEAMKKTITTFRMNDEADNKKAQLLARDLMRGHHGIAFDTPAGKKRH
jgi:hypothetical protein